MNGLFSSGVLDVAVGLIFVYLLLAVICSTINEWIASWFNLRSSNLKAAITQLLDGQPSTSGGQDLNWFLDKFYKHPLIAGMHKPSASSDGHPAYLPSRAFATVVMDLATPNQTGPITFQNLEDGIKSLPAGDVKNALLALIQNANRNLTTAQKNVETWFDDTMERMGGWYKKKIQIITIGVAILLVVGTNADTINMTSTLWRNPTQRAQMVEAAKVRAGNPNGGTQNPDNSELQNLDPLLGWGGSHKTVSQPEECWKVWAWRVLGWFLSIVAVSLGAPFWFDLLNKIVNLREAGGKPKTSDENTEEQAQAVTAASAPTAPPPPPAPPAPAAPPAPTGAPAGT